MTTRTLKAVAATFATAAGALVGVPAGALADLSFPDPAGSGASVTLRGVSSTAFVPGQRLVIEGSGFLPADRSPGAGRPVIAVKPYDLDPVWAFGGADALPGFGSDAQIWFRAAPDTGAFAGTIDVPAGLTPAGLLDGEQKGRHWLRILSGAFATDGGGAPNAGNRTAPITYTVPFTVLDRVTLGLTGPGAAGLFQAGTTFRAGAQVTVQGRAFAASTAVAVTLDGAPLASAITTDATGAFPAGARIALPAGTAPGSHTLTFSTGADPVSAAITVSPAPSAELVTGAVRPGGRFAFAFRDYLGVGATGQKVAIVVNEKTLACVTADGTGAGSGTAVLPSDTPEGSVVVGFNAGTSCLGPTGPVDDLPGTRVTAPLAVAAGAPSVTAAATAAAGSGLSVSGEGFAAGEVSATLDGAAVPSRLVADGDGRFSGEILVPAGTAVGEHTLVLKAGDRTAVVLFSATGPVVTPPVFDGPAPPVIAPPAVVPPAAVPPTVTPPATPPTVPIGKATAAPAFKALSVRGTKLRLTLTGTASTRTTISVRTAGKARTAARAKSKTITLATGRATKLGAVSLTLTRDGRALLRRVTRIKVTVKIAAPGRKTTTRTITLRG